MYILNENSVPQDLSTLIQLVAIKGYQPEDIDSGIHKQLETEFVKGYRKNVLRDCHYSSITFHSLFYKGLLPNPSLSLLIFFFFLRCSIKSVHIGRRASPEEVPTRV